MRPLGDSPVAQDGTVLLLAYDHGLEHGPVDFDPAPETSDPERVFQLATHDAVTSLAVGKGVAEVHAASYPDVPLVVKLNGATNLRVGSPDTAVNCSVDYAAELGADAVGFTVYPGSDGEVEQFEEFREAQEAARTRDLPVVLWSYPRGRGVKNDTSTDTVAYGARVALELGADVAKVKYPGSIDAMREVVRQADPVPVLLSGGPAVPDEAFLDRVCAARDAGVGGLAVGRNVWQHSDPRAMLDALEAVLYDGADTEAATARLP